MSIVDRPAPLAGVNVLEIGGVGPVPFAGMTLAGMGASVVRVERPAGTGVSVGDASSDSLNRGKRSAILNLKHPEGVLAALAMVEGADILIEGFRPGVMERLGIGPHDCFARNPRLVYGRMTGWGQDGPLAKSAGHDIAYIARTGALHAIGDAGRPPQVPVDFVGDFGGGATYLVMGVLAGLLHSRTTGAGRIVDAAIVDGSAQLLSGVHGLLNAGDWIDERGMNAYDGGAPYYAVYRTADDRHMAVGAVESEFYAELLRRLDLTAISVTDQHDRSTWSVTRKAIADAFAGRTQAAWAEVFADSDACVAPVLALREAAADIHLLARGTVRVVNGALQTAAAPRFDGTPLSYGSLAPRPGEHTAVLLAEAGIWNAADLLASGVAVQADVSDPPGPISPFEG